MLLLPNVVAALAKRETKFLIDLLITKSNEVVNKRMILPRRNNNVAVELLGQCLGSEIQINPDQLRDVLMLFVKSCFQAIRPG